VRVPAGSWSRLLAAFLFAGTCANASTVIQAFSMGTGNYLATDLNTALSVPQFDSAYGTLNQITITLTGYVQGDIAVENLSSRPNTVTAAVKAYFTLKLPDLTLLESVVASQTVVNTFSAFDGVNDRSGTSGTVYTGLTNSNTTTITLYSSSPLFSSFIGLSSLNLALSAYGQSSVLGSDILLSYYMASEAKANVLVQYYFDNGSVTPPSSVPEPGAAGLMAAALVSAAAIYRRQRIGRQP
jgi:hypothetical protein